MALSRLALSLLLACPLQAQGGIELVGLGSVWRYLDDGSNQGTAWRQPAFDDSGWDLGPAKLGYGDPGLSTVVSYGPFSFLKFITTYFRHEFLVDDPTEVAGLTLRLQRDDGAVVYLNGTEVVRTNLLPLVEVGYDLWATSNVQGSEEQELHTYTVPASLLVAGTNVLAVEVHQSNPFSSDLLFDLDLVAEADAVVTRGPYLQRGTPHEVTVRWRTSTATYGKVWYGDAADQLLAVGEETVPTTEHAVVLSGLQPDTHVYYAIGFGSTVLAGGDEDHAFTTSPPVGEPHPFRAWVLGDSGTANLKSAAVRDAYYGFSADTPTDLWLMLGDNAYDSGTDEEYQAAVFDMYPEMLAKSVLWPTRGNHEIFGSAYFGAFELPTGGEAGGVPSGTESYYSFDYANVHFVCLDSFLSNPLPGGDMWTWLEQDLANTTQDWIVAYWHHPPYSKGSHDSDIEPDLISTRINFLPLLEAGGVDLVLNGHSHSYERSYLIDGHYGFSWGFHEGHKKDPGDGRETGDGAYHKAPLPNAGTVYCVAGCSGKISGGDLDHPVMVHNENSLGSVVIDVDGERMDVRFLTSEGVVSDHFTIVNHVLEGMTATTTTVSLGAGGTQAWDLDAGLANADAVYVVLGSAHGTAPGIPLGTATLPLFPDGYTSATALLPPWLPGSLGVLDANGEAAAAFSIPPGLDASLAGVTLFHAFASFPVPAPCPGCASYTSAAVPVTLLP